MTDVELITSAAKAAGFLYDPSLTGEDGTLIGRYRSEADGPTYVWNPLTDLGDAIDMAAVIQIKLEYMQDRVWAHYGTGTHLSEALSQGAVQATCKVLTNIAAEVGKQFL
jgi:hypothetical protein